MNTKLNKIAAVKPRDIGRNLKTALLHNIFEWVKNELYGLVPWLGSVNMRAKGFRFRFAMVAARWRKRARTHILELFHPQNSYEMLAPS